jgi:hypothetical protein
VPCIHAYYAAYAPLIQISKVGVLARKFVCIVRTGPDDLAPPGPDDTAAEILKQKGPVVAALHQVLGQDTALQQCDLRI